MSSPFRVGEKYRNRKDEYEVVSIDGNHMVIRYQQGGTLSTTVTDQQRIWENILAEESIKNVTRRVAPPRSTAGRTDPTKAGRQQRAG